MNLTAWTGIREYIAAEIALALARRDEKERGGDTQDFATGLRLWDRIHQLEEQVTRMETSVREAL